MVRSAQRTKELGSHKVKSIEDHIIYLRSMEQNNPTIINILIKKWKNRLDRLKVAE